jgi:hypothetical protein
MESVGQVFPTTFEVDRAQWIANWRPVVQWLLAIPHFLCGARHGFDRAAFRSNLPGALSGAMAFLRRCRGAPETLALATPDLALGNRCAPRARYRSGG